MTICTFFKKVQGFTPEQNNTPVIIEQPLYVNLRSLNTLIFNSVFSVKTYKCTKYKVVPFLYICTLTTLFYRNLKNPQYIWFVCILCHEKIKNKVKQYIKAGGIFYA